MFDPNDDPPGLMAFLAKLHARRESAARLNAAREALNKVEPHQFHTCCPVCNGAGTLAVIFGAKDDEHV